MRCVNQFNHFLNYSLTMNQMDGIELSQVETCYQKLLAIVNSSRDDSDKTHEIKALIEESKFYIYAVLSHPNTFYSYLLRSGLLVESLITQVSLLGLQEGTLFFQREDWTQLVMSHTKGAQLICFIATSSPQATKLFFQHEKVIQLFMSLAYGARVIYEVAKSSPEASELFFQYEKVIQLVVSHAHGTDLIRNIASLAPKAANAFLFKDGDVRKIHSYAHPSTTKWIDTVLEKALTQPEQFEQQIMWRLIADETKVDNAKNDIAFFKLISQDNRNTIQPIIDKVVDIKATLNTRSEVFGFKAINHVFFCLSPEKKQRVAEMSTIYHARAKHFGSGPYETETLGLENPSRNNDCKLFQSPLEIIELIFKHLINIDYPPKQHNAVYTEPQESQSHILRMG